MSLINKVDMVGLLPVGYGVWLTFQALTLHRSSMVTEGCHQLFHEQLRYCIDNFL